MKRKFTISEALSYQLPIIEVFGLRGLGKTYTTKAYIFKRIMEDKDNEEPTQFIYLVGTSDEKKDFLKDNRIIEEGMEKKYGDIHLEKDIIMNGKQVCGWVKSLSQYDKMKKSRGAYAHVKYILFDEFNIPRIWRYSMRPSDMLVNIIQTVKGSRPLSDLRIFMLGNAITIDDVDFNNNFQTMPDLDQEFTVYRQKGVVIQIPDAEKYSLWSPENDQFQALVSASSYGQMAYQNKFNDENADNIVVRSKDAIPVLTIKDESDQVVLYYDDERGESYISQRVSNTKEKINLDPNFSSGENYYKYKDSPFYDVLKDCLNSGKLYYTDRSARVAGIRLLTKLNIY